MSGSSVNFDANSSDLPKWQSDLINQILNSMQDFYCVPDKFNEEKMSLETSLINKCKKINAELLSSASDRPPSIENYTAFVNQLNVVLHDFDTHLELQYNPKFIDEMNKNNKVEKSHNSAKFNFSGGPPRDEVQKWNKYEEENPTTRNFGFVDYQGQAVVIPKNIGYINISHLIDPQLGADEKESKYRMGPNAIKRLHEVMRGFQDEDAIVLDLSVTPYGGSPEMVQNIVSFFVPEHTLINTVHDRVTGKPMPYESISTPFKLLDKPVALLVGPNTFSGREETAYDLQQYNTTLHEGRFTVIGQPTKGGAHPQCSFPLVDASSGVINDNLILLVPYARSVNPVSGTNWEKKGIQPDILVKSEDALAFSVTYLQERIKISLSESMHSSIAVDDESKRSGSSSHSSRSHVITAPPTTGYPRASQSNMSVTSKMTPNPNDEHTDAESKDASTPTPFKHRLTRG